MLQFHATTRRLQTKKPFLAGMLANHVADSLIPNGIQRHSLPARVAELSAFNSARHLVRTIGRFAADYSETASLFVLAGTADSIHRKFGRMEMHICRTYRWKAAMHCPAAAAIASCVSDWNWDCRNCDLEGWLAPFSCGAAIICSHGFVARLTPLSVLLQFSGEAMLVRQQSFGVLIGAFHVG